MPHLLHPHTHDSALGQILFLSPALQNFMASIFEAQYGRKLVLTDGQATQLGEMMDRLNLFFTIYFAVELVINAYAHWLRVFVSNGWNHLDVFIVVISLFDVGMTSVPTWLVQLMRAFRVIRLFGRISTLKKMTSAVTASIIPMMNAFVILLIVVSICGSHHHATQVNLAYLVYILHSCLRLRKSAAPDDCIASDR